MISSPSLPVRQTVWLRHCAVKYQVFMYDVIHLLSFTIKHIVNLNHSVDLICILHCFPDFALDF